MASHSSQTIEIANSWAADAWATFGALIEPENALIERIQVATAITWEPAADPQFPNLAAHVAIRLVDVINGGNDPAFSANPLSTDWDEGNVIDWYQADFITDGYWDDGGQALYVWYGHSPVVTRTYDVAHHVPAGYGASLQVAIWNGAVSPNVANNISCSASARMWTRHNIL